MLMYYGDKISPHMTTSPEGFLICHDCHLAKSGDLQYSIGELRQAGYSSQIPANIPNSQKITVHRPPEVVFSDISLASAQDKPFVDGHRGTVTADNYAQLPVIGHVANVHRGKDLESDWMIGDLIVNKRPAIKKIKSDTHAVRGLSGGYAATYNFNDDFTEAVQTGQVYNHVALVDQDKARAGRNACIQDSVTEDTETPIIEDSNSEVSANMNDKMTELLQKFMSIFQKANLIEDSTGTMAADGAEIIKKITTPDAPMTTDSQKGEQMGEEKTTVDAKKETEDAKVEDCTVDAKTDSKEDKAEDKKQDADDAKKDDAKDADDITKALKPIMDKLDAMGDRISKLETGEKGETKDCVTDSAKTEDVKTEDCTADATTVDAKNEDKVEDKTTEDSKKDAEEDAKDKEGDKETGDTKDCTTDAAAEDLLAALGLDDGGDDSGDGGDGTCDSSASKVIEPKKEDATATTDGKKKAATTDSTSSISREQLIKAINIMKPGILLMSPDEKKLTTDSLIALLNPDYAKDGPSTMQKILQETQKAAAKIAVMTTDSTHANPAELAAKYATQNLHYKEEK